MSVSKIKGYHKFELKLTKLVLENFRFSRFILSGGGNCSPVSYTYEVYRYRRKYQHLKLVGFLHSTLFPLFLCVSVGILLLLIFVCLALVLSYSAYHHFTEKSKK